MKVERLPDADKSPWYVTGMVDSLGYGMKITIEDRYTAPRELTFIAIKGRRGAYYEVPIQKVIQIAMTLQNFIKSDLPEATFLIPRYAVDKPGTWVLKREKELLSFSATSGLITVGFTLSPEDLTTFAEALYERGVFQRDRYR